MKKSPPAANPNAYVESLDGWRRELVTLLRSAVHAAGTLEEVVKWGHLVYLAEGPVLLIRAEDHRVLFGFWRGQRLTSIEPRLKPGGKYEMATLDLREGMTIDRATAQHLVREAIALDQSLGNPTLDAKKVPAKKRAAKKRPASKDKTSSRPLAAKKSTRATPRATKRPARRAPRSR